MTAVVFEPWGPFGGHVIDRATETLYRVSAENEEPSTFPTSERIARAWEEMVPDAGPARVIGRYKACIMLVLPKGMNKSRRRAFEAWLAEQVTKA
jgi:hypothetical protein